MLKINLSVFDSANTLLKCPVCGEETISITPYLTYDNRMGALCKTCQTTFLSRSLKDKSLLHLNFSMYPSIYYNLRRIFSFMNKSI